MRRGLDTDCSATSVLTDADVCVTFQNRVILGGDTDGVEETRWTVNDQWGGVPAEQLFGQYEAIRESHRWYR